MEDIRAAEPRSRVVGFIVRTLITFGRMHTPEPDSSGGRIQLDAGDVLFWGLYHDVIGDILQ